MNEDDITPAPEIEGWSEGVDDQGNISYTSMQALGGSDAPTIFVDTFGVSAAKIPAQIVNETTGEWGPVAEHDVAIVEFEGVCASYEGVADGHKHSFVGLFKLDQAEAFIDMLTTRIAHYKLHGE